MTPPQPQDAVALLNQGIEQLQAGNYSAALDYFDRALAINPNDPNIWEKRALALQNLGNYAAAIASNNIALSFYSGDFKFFSAEAWFNRGNQQAMVGDFLGAIASFNQAVQIKPDLHEAWFNRGVALGNLGEFEEAIASFDQAVQIKPNLHKAWFNRGVALGNLGEFEEAIASYDKAIEFNPDFHDAWFNRGNALLNLGQIEEAIASYDQVLQFKPSYHDAWHKRGVALKKLGRLDKALASYDKALEIQPNYCEAWNDRGVLLFRWGHYEEAISSYDNALKIEPNYHQAWSNRGNALNKLGHHEEALCSYDKALEIKPNSHEALYNKGMALFNLERYEEAISSYDKALQIQLDSYQAWINRGSAAGRSVSCEQLLALRSAITWNNSALKQRRYEGALASLKEGFKYVHQNSHPEGWGLLHQAIGNAHYFQGKGKPNYRDYWRKAVAEYRKALITLTQEAPEQHLEVVRDLIRVFFGLGKDAVAKQWRQHGLEVFRQLLNSQKTPFQRRQLEVKFSGFSQMRVDVLVEDGELVSALEAAERNKNFYLTWILDAQKEQILSPSYQEIQQLVNPTTAIIYWHLSSFALTTFIIKHSADEPIVIKEPLPNPPLRGEGERLPPPVSRGLREVQRLEAWVNDWNKQYQGDRKGKKQKGETTTSWQDNLPQLLKQLDDILNIAAILSELTNINQVILIPHRELHRFPLHALFPDTFTIAYLPSAQIGLNLQSERAQSLTPLLSVEHPNSKDFDILPHAEIESAAIAQLFNIPDESRISGQAATKTAIKDTLTKGYKTFHFTGHGTYNFQHPKQSALFLSGEDKLTLDEICSINLSGYQLVSLAACETALTGNQTITEDYVGLVSAFLYQRIAYVVSTLWTVPDLASSLVMIYFYWQLKKGKSPTVAIAKATKWLRNLTDRKLERLYKVILPQLPQEQTLLRSFLEEELEYRIPTIELSQKQQKRFENPYYWAAFIITGGNPS